MLFRSSWDESNTFNLLKGLYSLGYLKSLITGAFTTANASATPPGRWLVLAVTYRILAGQVNTAVLNEFERGLVFYVLRSIKSFSKIYNLFRVPIPILLIKDKRLKCGLQIPHKGNHNKCSLRFLLCRRLGYLEIGRAHV